MLLLLLHHYSMEVLCEGYTGPTVLVVEVFQVVIIPLVKKTCCQVRAEGFQGESSSDMHDLRVEKLGELGLPGGRW